MPIWLAALVVSTAAPYGTFRDAYGVPQVRASSLASVYEGMGYAVAEDRLWQMELSRRIARSRMAEIMGSSALASDIATYKMGYSDAELSAMLKGLKPETQQAFTSYAKGVNALIAAQTKSGTLPPGYAQYGIKPEPWTTLDSAAVGVRLARLFGTGGAGELRNYLLKTYLQGQKVGPKALDAVDDLAWFNDPDSPTTVATEDDPLAKAHPVFNAPSRSQTEAHIRALPPSSLFELLPATQLASLEDTRRVAEANNVLFKTGSYAIVVSGKRSASGKPMLLGGPQMGHTIPSVVHEVSLQAPGLRVTGMNVPGIPGVLIGHTPDLAWTFTSGVADVTDIFYTKKSGEAGYLVDGKTLPVVHDQRKINVRGAESVIVERTRTKYGPVVLDSKIGNTLYSQRSTFWKRELIGIEGIYGLTKAKTSAEAIRSSKLSPLSFNFFFATRSGEIGWRYCGLVPLRAPGLDTRFPTPGDAQHDWRGLISADQMPYVINPQSGLITNWNNKPAAWWPNWDTPVWGKHFRVAALRQNLPSSMLKAADLEKAIWSIARQDEGSWRSFMPLIRRALSSAKLTGTERLAANLLVNFNGWLTEGSRTATIYTSLISELRQALFVPYTGNFLTAANLNLVVQTSPLDHALNGRTKVNYLNGRTADEVILEAFKRATKSLSARNPDPMKWLYNPGVIRSPEGPNVPYVNRGTYIQILEAQANGWRARSVAEPGVSERGSHSADQMQLARDWSYKPMWAP